MSFDAKGHPEAATGAIMVANKIFWTLGYWQVENHLIRCDPISSAIAETAMFTTAVRRPTADETGRSGRRVSALSPKC